MNLKIKVDKTQLENLRKNLAQAGGFEAKVGVLKGDKDVRQPKPGEDSDLNNATVGLKQEFGSIMERIPARSFIRMPLQTHFSDNLQKIEPQFWNALFAEKGAEHAMRVIGVKGENTVQEAFATSGWGKWAPNSPLTIELKGSSKPLIDTGQLRRSISSEVVEK